MRRVSIAALCAAVLSAAAPAGVLAAPAENDAPVRIQPIASPRVSVEVGGELADKVEGLGDRDVRDQLDNLARVVSRALERDADGDARWAGAQFNLVLTELKPNRPTMQQAIDRPGLSIFDSVSIGGATIEGEVVTADGQRLPVRYSRYSNSIADVFGFNTWEDANRAYQGFASNLQRGRLVKR